MVPTAAAGKSPPVVISAKEVDGSPRQGGAVQDLASPFARTPGPRPSPTSVASLDAVAPLSGPDPSLRREPGDAGSRDLHLRLVWPLLTYVRDTYGEPRLNDLLERVGLRAAARDNDLVWVSHPTFEALLEGARAVMTNDDEFLRACGYRMREYYGPLYVMFRAASLARAFQAMARTAPMVSHISRFELSPGQRRRSVIIRYTSTRAGSRLMCLSRRGQWRTAPTTLWNLPPATLWEHTQGGRVLS
jgi:hypothetical protein